MAKVRSSAFLPPMQTLKMTRRHRHRHKHTGCMHTQACVTSVVWTTVQPVPVLREIFTNGSDLPDNWRRNGERHTDTDTYRQTQTHRQTQTDRQTDTDTQTHTRRCVGQPKRQCSLQGIKPTEAHVSHTKNVFLVQLHSVHAEHHVTPRILVLFCRHGNGSFALFAVFVLQHLS